MRFLQQILTSKHHQNTRDLIALGLESRQLLKALLVENEIQFDYAKTGIANIYKTQSAYRAGLKNNAEFDQYGWNRHAIGLDELHQLDQNLVLDDVVGAIYSADDGCGNLYLFCQALAQLMQAHGVSFHFQQTLTTQYRKQNQWHLVFQQSHEEMPFDQVILANGATIDQFLPQSSQTYPVKGYSVSLDLSALPALDRPKICLLDEACKIATAPLGQQFRVAGMVEWVGFDDRPVPAKINQLQSWVQKNYPQLDPLECDCWACLRPMRPNMQPKVGLAQPNLWLHAGGGHLGWTNALLCLINSVR